MASTHRPLEQHVGVVVVVGGVLLLLLVDVVLRAEYGTGSGGRHRLVREAELPTSRGGGRRVEDAAGARVERADADRRCHGAL